MKGGVQQVSFSGLVAVIIYVTIIGALTLSTLPEAVEASCVTPTGISTDGSGDTLASANVDAALARVAADPEGGPYLFLPFVEDAIGAILRYETS